MALGNLLGLRTIPTGVNLYTNGNPTPFTAGGNINVGQITFTGDALGSATTPGTVKYGWANNSSSVSDLFSDSVLRRWHRHAVLGLQPAALYRPRCRSEPSHAVRGDLQPGHPASHHQQPFARSHLCRQPRHQAARTVGHQSAVYRSAGSAPAGVIRRLPAARQAQCLASAASGYDNCAPNSAAITAAQPYSAAVPVSELHLPAVEQQHLQLQRSADLADAADPARPLLRNGLHLVPRSGRIIGQLELHPSDQQPESEVVLLVDVVRYPAALHRLGYLRDSRNQDSRASSWKVGRSTPF